MASFSRIRVDIEDAGAIAVLQDPAVAAKLLSMGHAVAAAGRAAAPGAEFEVSLRNTATRARVSVITANYKARKAEATSRALTRALEAARSA